MSNRNCGLSRLWLAGIVLGGAGLPAFGENALSLRPDSGSTATVATAMLSSAVAQDGGSSAFNVDLKFSYYTDYVFRGRNLSEYGREGREMANYQGEVSIGMDVGQLVGQQAGTCGTFTFTTWGEWYAAQEKINGNAGGDNMQEVDYVLAWSYGLDEIASTVELGYIFYTYPNATGGNTQEWYFSIEHNDAWLWKGLIGDGTEAVLNPTFTMYHDIDAAGGDALWFEIGLSHECTLAENLVLTPSWTLGIDHNYYRYVGAGPTSNTTRFGNMLWGLDLTYDVTQLLGVPDDGGSVAVSTFVYFSDALGNAENNGVIQDEFFGGMSIGWSF